MSGNLHNRTNEVFSKNKLLLYSVIIVIIAVAVGYINKWLIIPYIVLVCLAYYLLNAQRINEARYYNDTLANVIRNIERANHFAVNKMDLGTAVFSGKGELQWYNDKFAKMVGHALKYGDLIKDVLPLKQNKISLDMYAMKDGKIELQIEDRFYSVKYFKVETLTPASKKGKKNVKPVGLAVYLTDITETRLTIDQFENNRLCLAYVRFDNMESVLNDLTELNKANIIGDVNGVINKWVGSKNGFVCRQNSQQALVGFPVAAVQDLMEEKFTVLDEVKKIRHGNKISPTLSIGLACDGTTYEELAKNAEQQLNDVISRGGDQALVLVENQQKSFGGAAPVQQKQERVRVRTTTHTIRERILQADKVFVMGHKREDFDAIGASIGMAKFALFLGKSTHIVISPDYYDMEAITKVLTDENKNSDEDDTRYLSLMVTEEQALPLIGDGKNLLIIVDHHRSVLSASEAVLNKIENRIIIDHHRRSSDIIGGNVLTYLEPNSSSTCELVTEMSTFMDERLRFTTAEATLLYSGIVLDTKNFIVQTGTRTFQASALLKEAGANLELVRWLFKDDFDSSLLKAKIFAAAKLHEPRFAVAKYENADPSRRKELGIIASQVADSLIAIHGISSAVSLIAYSDGTVNLSARSDGSVNIHVVAEQLGGGGHQYQAGAQFPNKKFAKSPSLKEIEDILVVANKEQWDAKAKAEAEAKAQEKENSKENENNESNSVS
ncbi:MAG: DHH family phosphoesterase [Phascolarctobacterium sp.]|nr:DHH family phosphoesterase [Phascolarctobacterium sp.]